MVISAMYQGQFLIAANHLRDANFFRSVVLILEHNQQGAMGLVVNRPSSVSVEKALSEHLETGVCETPVYVGGPVETSALFIMHNCLALGQHDQEIVPGLFLAGSHESFETVVRDGLQPENGVRFRVFCGYAGWGANQLESEIARGDWHCQQGDSQIVLEQDPYGAWDVCTRRLQRANRILPHNVRNPEWN
jgi:putative transcriptional regulator